MAVTRDVHFNEGQKWDWNNSQIAGSFLNSVDNHLGEQTTKLMHNELEDDLLIRGKRPLSDIYQRCNVAIYELASCKEALKDPKWKIAMEEEMSMIHKRKTLELVERPEDRKIIRVKWIFRTKLNADSSVNKHKVRLVVKGYVQTFGIDYSDTFAPVSRLDTIRLVLIVASQKGWKVFQLDVKLAFLNRTLQEEIYVEQPEGFVKQGKEDKVYLLKKALYGLKQAPRAW